jgi:hypothetical protein
LPRNHFIPFASGRKQSLAGGIREDATSHALRRVRCKTRSQFDGTVVARLNLQLAHIAIFKFDVVTHLAEILRLHEFSIGSGMAVEVLIMPTSA